MAFQYLLDENISPEYRVQLLRGHGGMVVRRIGDPGCPPEGTADPEILHWCESRGFLLVTMNRRSMPIHLCDHLANDGHVPGILMLGRKAEMGRVLESLFLIHAAGQADDFADRIVYVPL